MRFKNYINSYSRKNKIYSDEDLLKMTLSKLFDNEQSIMSQDSMIGIPTLEELEQSPNTEWIAPFKNERGEDDGGYWQSILQPEYRESIDSKQSDLGALDKDGWVNTGYLEPVYMAKAEEPFGQVEGDEEPEEVFQEGDVFPYPKTIEGKVEENVFKDEIEKPEVGFPEEEPLLKGNAYKRDNKFDELQHNIQSTVNNVKTKIGDIQRKYEGLHPVAAVQKAASKAFGDDFVENEYYRNSLKMKDGEPFTDKFLEENDIYNYQDITDPEKANYYKEQLAKMYGLDINDPDINEKLKDKKIVVPKESSRLYQYIKNSETLEKWVLDNYDKLKNGGTDYTKDITFPLGGFNGALNNKQRGLFATIHNANMRDMKINTDGSVTGRIDDPYNFEKWDKKNGINFSQKIKNFVFNRYVDINNNAQKQQGANQLEQFLTSIPIHLTKEEIEEILKRKRKKL